MITETSQQDSSPHRVVANIRYVKPDESGWLWVRIEDPAGIKEAQSALANQEKYFLCENTKLMTLEEGDRVIYKVLDGFNKGMKVSLAASNVDKHAVKQGPKVSDEGCLITVEYTGEKIEINSIAKGRAFSQALGLLRYDNINVNISFLTEAVDPTFTILPEGNYKILAPINAHKLTYTQPYKDSEPSLNFHQVWFAIEYEDNSRFIHVGAISEGCITVLELNKWNNLYRHLISHRNKSGAHVGVLHVKRPQ